MKNKPDCTDKPYNRCLSCPHRGVRCDGPRTAGLPLPRWKEYMRDMKELNELTNADVVERAEKAGTPITIKTVERALSPTSTQDIMRDTARVIENAIVGLTSRYPCYLAFEEEHPANEQKLNDVLHELEKALADNGEYKDILKDIHRSYNTEMEEIRAEGQRKIDFLLRQLEHARADNERLWAENNRKSKMIDIFVENKTGWLVTEEDA